MEPVNPLGYAPPPVRRRSRFVAALVAYLVASYAVGLTAFAVSVAATPAAFTGGAGLVVLVLATPLWFPASMARGAMRGGINLWWVSYLGAFVVVFALAYRFLRRPLGRSVTENTWD